MCLGECAQGGSSEKGVPYGARCSSAAHCTATYSAGLITFGENVQLPVMDGMMLGQMTSHRDSNL